MAHIDYSVLREYTQATVREEQALNSILSFMGARVAARVRRGAQMNRRIDKLLFLSLSCVPSEENYPSVLFPSYVDSSESVSDCAFIMIHNNNKHKHMLSFIISSRT